jgi:hypothetical protein
MVISILTLVLLIVQTHSLVVQTRAVAKGLEYSAFLTLVDSLNQVNLSLMSDSGVQDMFRDVGYIADNVGTTENLSIGKLALAWHHFNRYEAAFEGFRQGILPDGQWDLWRRRVALDLKAPFLREAWHVESANYAYDPGFLAFMNEAVGRADPAE